MVNWGREVGLTRVFAEEFSDIVDFAFDNDPGIFLSIVLCDFFGGVRLH